MPLGPERAAPSVVAGPRPGLDLDLLVRIDPTALGGRSGPWIQRTLRSIADDFDAEAGAPGSTGNANIRTEA